MRDQRPRLARDQPVRLRVVDLAAGDGADEARELVRVHLVVGRHHAGDVDPLLARPQVAGHDRGADAAVLLVDDDLDPGVGDGSRARRPSRPARRRRRRRSGRRSPGSPAGSRRRGAPPRTRGRRRRHACPRPSASGYAALRAALRWRNGSAIAAASAPSSRPISAPIRAELRRLVAVVLLATARLDDLALLHVLGQREQLLVLEQLLLHGAAALLREADRVVEAADHDQLVGRRDASCRRSPPAAAATAFETRVLMSASSAWLETICLLRSAIFWST